MRPRHQRSPVTIKATEVAIVDRAFEEGWIVAQPAGAAQRQARGGDRIGSRGSRGGGAAQSRRPHRDGVRARRSDRRAAALRHSRVQAGEALARSPPRSDAAEGVCSARAATSASICPPTTCARDFDAVVLAGGATLPRDLPVPGRELAGIHFAMEYLPPQNRRCEGDELADERNHHRRREARRDHRRRRHGRGLPGHGAPPGRRAASRSSSCCRARPTTARRATRGRSGRTSSACRPRTRRGASALFAVSTERFIGDAAGRVTTLRAVRVESATVDGRPSLRAGAGLRADDLRRSRAARDGVSRAGALGHARRVRRAA